MLRRRGVNKAADERNTVPAVKHLFTVISFIHFSFISFSHANLKPFFLPPYSNRQNSPENDRQDQLERCNNEKVKVEEQLFIFILFLLCLLIESLSLKG